MLEAQLLMLEYPEQRDIIQANLYSPEFRELVHANEASEAILGSKLSPRKLDKAFEQASPSKHHFTTPNTSPKKAGYTGIKGVGKLKPHRLSWDAMDEERS